MKRALALAVSLALALPVLLAAAPARAGEVMVIVGHNRLEPGELTIEAGDTVIFHNVDEMPGGHTVVSESGDLSSPPLDVDGKWSHTFEEPGTWRFKIQEHPGATVTVNVE